MCSLLLSTSCGGAASNASSASIPQVRHVVILVLENANYSDVVGSVNAPYINGLIAQGGLATNYFANHHPSLPNYFVMTTGMSPTVTDSASVLLGDNVVHELQAAAKSWKVYVENLPKTGYVGPTVFPYLRPTNAFSYFSDLQPPSALAANVVDITQLTADLNSNTLPAYSFVIPNAFDNGHSCPEGEQTCAESVLVSDADTWLSHNLPTLLNNSEFQQSGLLLLTTDESRDDNTHGGGHIMTALLGTGVKAGYKGDGMYDHRSLLSLSLTALGVTAIPNGAGEANQMNEFFGQ